MENKEHALAKKLDELGFDVIERHIFSLCRSNRSKLLST